MSKRAKHAPSRAGKTWRLLNQDGTFNVDRQGLRRTGYSDMYHQLLSTSWLRFFGLLVLTFFSVNAFFGLLYFLCGPEAIQGMAAGSEGARYLECFFFSVQTLATIGYGRMSPMGVPANLVVTFEAMTGLLGLALATGLLFSRFSRPTARVAFSRNALMTPHDGIPSLMFRMANRRLNQIVEARVRVTISMNIVTAEGERYRDFAELHLERHLSPLFALSWTVVHPIDANSPLHGLTADDLVKREVELLVSLTGIDDTFSQSITTRFSYSPEDIVWNAFFEDMLFRNQEEGTLRVDLTRLSQIRPLEGHTH